MASRHNYSPYFSRSSSPDAYQERYERYDPFDPTMDRIEMANLRGPSIDVDTSRGFQGGPSPPDDPALRSPPQDSYFPDHRGEGPNSQYTAVPQRRVSQAQTSTTVINSLFSTNSTSAYKTKDADAQALMDRRAGEIAKWDVHWSTPAIMVALFIAGVGGALGHHFFYSGLDGEPAKDQLRQIRYGTALAFFVKSTLVGSIILCYRQRIWHTFRKKAMTIRAIDGLFAATEDPMSFLNWEMIRNGKLATLMALCSWLIPIASVLSPASLTSELRTSLNPTTCDAVPNLNFAHESLYNFRHEDEFPGSSLAYYNTTDIDGKEEGYFDYYDQPSKNARRLAVTSAYLRKPPARINASFESCGEGWNCTYSINFEGPGYKCVQLANSTHPDLNDDTAPFNISSLAPEGDYLYRGSVDINDYKNPQTDTGNDGVPVEGPPYEDNLGVFQSEPVLWIGYAINTSKPYDSDSPYAKTWKTVHEPKIFKCVAHNTNYTFEMRYNDSVQTTKRLSREFLDPIVDTTLTVDDGGNATDITAVPTKNYVRPIDRKKYKRTAAYHAMGSLLRNFLRGDIRYTPPYFVTKSDISETRLMEASTSYPVHNLMEAVQEAYEDMLITLLSEPHLVIADTSNVPCDKTQIVNVYVYHAEGLWIGYAIVVAVALLFIFVGAWSIYQNGVSCDTHFSRIMVTTRNPTIDRMSVGACLGGDPFPKELRETKLRFGVLLEDDPKDGPLGTVEHCCFGTAGETKEIVKYGTYAGLKKWRKDSEEEVGDASEKQALIDKDGMQ